MKNSTLHLTLRQMQVEFSNPAVWIILCGIGIVLAVAGAFDTASVMRPLPLGLYWIGIVVLTYATGSFLNGICSRVLQNWSRWPRLLLTGLVIGISVFTIILGINTALFGAIFQTANDLMQFGGMVIGITCLVTIVLDIAFAAARPVTDEASAPDLLDRLPFDQRGALIALSVEDHYVRVRTTHGETMLLMRLGDAIKETAPTRGLQVHRSHWVASDAIQSATRSGNGATLSLSHGADIPVSRSKLPELKAAGFL